MSLSQLNQLYRQVILDHGQHPRHFGKLDHTDQEVELFNPTCGDAIVLSLKIKDDHIVDLAFSGQGCTISMASASMMCEALLGKTKEQALAMIATFQALVGGPGQVDESWEQALGGLPSPVWSHNRMNFSCFEGQVDPFKDFLTFNGHMQILDF